MKRILISVLVLLSGIKTQAQTPPYQWAKLYGSTDYDSPYDIIADNYGNTYVAGWFSDSTIIGNVALINPLYESAGILIKLNAAGNVTWVKRLQNYGFAEIEEMAFDNTGNLVITGTFSDTLVIGATTLISAGLNDLLVAKYDTSGNPIWAVSAGNVGSETGFKITTDPQNNIIVTGVFQFVSPFAGVPLTVYGQDDIFVAKFDASGTVIWAQSCGGMDYDRPWGLVTDQQGNVFISGKSDFNFNYGTQSWNAFQTIFIGEITAAGNLSTVKVSNGGWITTYISGLEKDANDNFYTLVTTTPNFSFDSVALVNPTSYVLGAIKLDHNLNVIWIKNIGGSHDAGVSEMVTDASGNCYFAGGFADTIVFGNSTFTSPGFSPITYIAKIDSGGNGVWAQVNSCNSTSDISMNGSGCMYVSGDASGLTTYGSINLTAAGQSDIYVARICQSSVGINELNDNKQIVIYPNPTTDFVSFNNDVQCSHIIISDLTGATVLNKEFSNPVSVSELKQGVYFLNLTDDKGLSVGRQKLVKM